MVSCYFKTLLIALFASLAAAEMMNSTSGPMDHMNMTHDHSHDEVMNHTHDHHDNHTHETTAIPFDFQCETESTIHLGKSAVCNGARDCPDGSDETEETCLNVMKRCPPGKYRCRNEPRCLTHDLICDGKSDCAGGSDESKSAGCPMQHMLLANESNCPEKFSACGEPFMRCIPDASKCDYVKDCEMGEDELKCPNGKTCPSEFFHCYKTADHETKFYFHCVENIHKCDRVPHCPNGEDESDEVCVTGTMGHDHSHRDHGAHPKSAAGPIAQFSNAIIGLFFLLSAALVFL